MKSSTNPHRLIVMSVAALVILIANVSFASISFASISLASVSLASVSSSNTDEEAPIQPSDVKLDRPVDFAKDIAPIFRANCVACHNKAKSEGQLILEDTVSIMKGGSSGEVIIPGKPDDSYLYTVAARIDESYMPPMPNEVQAKKLTPDEVGLLRQWILEGAKAGSADSAATMSWQTINTELNAIYSVDADPFGRFIAAGRAGNVQIYDMLAGQNGSSLIDPELIAKNSPQQKAHLDYVHAVAFHPGGQMLATSGFQVVKLWERDFTSAIQLRDELPNFITNHLVSPDATLTAFQNEVGIVAAYSDHGTKPVHQLSGYLPAEWTLLGIGGPQNQHVSFASDAGVVKIVSWKDGTEVAKSNALPSKVLQAVHTESGNTMVVLQEDGSLQSLTVQPKDKTLSLGKVIKSDAGTIKEISLSSTTLMCRLEDKLVELRSIDSLASVATIQPATPNATAVISTDATKVVTVSADGIAELWNAKDAKLIAKLTSDLLANRSLIQAATDKTVRDARVKVVKGQITEDEKRVTEQQESLKKANEEVKKATEALTVAKKKASEEAAKLTAAKKASEDKPDEDGLKKKLAAATKTDQTAKDGVVAAENSLKSANKGVQLSQQAIVRAEANVAERKQLLASVEAEAKFASVAHAAADAKAKATISSLSAAFVGDNVVATIDVSGTTRLWNKSDGSAVDVLPASFDTEKQPTKLVGNQQTVLVQHADGRFSSISPFLKWKLKTKLGPQGEGQPSVFVDRVLALAFSPDGKLLAAGGGEASRSGELTMWNVADGKLTQTITDAHSDTVYGLDFSRDGKLLASAAADKFIKVFDVATGKHVRSYEGHTHHVMDVSWKGDRTQLASAGADNAIKVWNAETGEQSRTITTYKKQVTSLEFIGMEDEFISSSGDKRVFRHRAANGKTVREFKGCLDYVYCSAATTDGLMIAAGCEDGILRIWNGKDGKEIAAFKP